MTTADTARSQGFLNGTAGTLYRDDGTEFEQCFTRLHTVNQEGQFLDTLTTLATTRERAQEMAQHWSTVLEIPGKFQGKDHPSKPGKVEPKKS